MMHKTFLDYEGFVEKFKLKKTTDDCYTPQWLYDTVVRFISEEVTPLEGVEIIRPFWPGADYRQTAYPEGCAVIDNPPFSIFSEILRFYRHEGVRFFLFGPALSIANKEAAHHTCVVCGENIIYENGARVSTSFVTNMWPGNPAVAVSGRLCRLMVEGQRKARKSRENRSPKYELPDGVVTCARLQKIANAGIDLTIGRDESLWIRNLESLRRKGKHLFGNGWILSREAAAREAAAREAAAREAAARETHYWTLSAQEELLMDILSKGGQSHG